MPELRELSSFTEALSQAMKEGRRGILLHEAANGSSSSSRSWPDNGKPIAIAVGPEGGFSEDEVRLALNAGAEIVSLGPRRLRAETAAIASLAILIEQ
jgi:16S rRNA (uracil1498-N3)-methyltransferase